LNTESNPFGIYVHWPYCARVCPYCDFNIYKDKGGDDALHAAIIADIGHHAQRIGKREAVSVHFGGGTPSLLSPKAIEGIIAAAADSFGLTPNAEISLEANPDGFTQERARDFSAAGINRLSLGVQAFDDQALKALGRTHDAAQGFAAIGAAQSAFPRVSVDLIYARQDQDIMSWRRELKQAAETGVTHISPYQLTIEDGTAFALAKQRGSLRTPSNDLAADFYDATQEVLEAAGLPAYEISNHAASLEDRSQHNLLYWRSHDWVGVGPGAHGRIVVDGVRCATEAHKLPADYVAAVDRAAAGWSECAPLSAEDIRAEGILMGLRIAEGLELARWTVAPKRTQALIEDGFARLENGRLHLTARGRLLADHIGADLCG
jgi:putative oxygen-independent coproporphyrinogen III oxidase